MEIKLIEPTPSPNTMKLHLDETLEAGIRKTYTLDNERSAPPIIARLLHVEGVKSIFHTTDFMAIDRKPGADWPAILSGVQEVFGSRSDLPVDSDIEDAAGHFGEAQVFVQFFRGIPMQIRVKSGLREERIGLAQRFVDAVTEVASATMIKERKLTDYGVRYGDLPDIAREVEQELEAAFPQERLERVIKQAIAHGAKAEEFVEQRREWSQAEIEETLAGDDWRRRYAALEAMEASEQTLPLIERALGDDKMQVRRLAVVYLGDLKTPDAMQLLFRAMKDGSPAVRRTAGDTLSDIGDPSATQVMLESLTDVSKIVRWRAARFLYEVGTADAREALEQASNDPEFEVGLQARMALERIDSGEEAAGTIWQQMAKSRQKPGDPA
ncbi:MULTISPECIES: virulence factor [Saccharibacillus]|uniref:virulence factor n=1 Tax=Saccharibacillus TaxID=456492 RepID=UPI0012384B2F|nr:virulence factor [Saccharibacillus sp. WB 17]MWJ29844.1 virulence factor [Saccharibacillus sp. WB 17]